MDTKLQAMPWAWLRQLELLLRKRRSPYNFPKRTLRVLRFVQVLAVAQKAMGQRERLQHGKC